MKVCLAESYSYLFRNINLEALVALRMGGKSYDWDHGKRKFVEAA